MQLLDYETYELKTTYTSLDQAWEAMHDHLHAGYIAQCATNDDGTYTVSKIPCDN